MGSVVSCVFSRIDVLSIRQETASEEHDVQVKRYEESLTSLCDRIVELEDIISLSLSLSLSL